MTKKVFGWMADRAGCGYYRIAQPLTQLAATGHDTWHHTVMPDHHTRYNVIIGQRVAQPGPTTTWQNLARAGQQFLVYELDDDLLNVDHTSTEAHAFFSQPHIRENIARNASMASAVTVSTEPLAERMRVFNPNVHVVPNFIPAWLLDHTPPRNDGPVTIGWGGSGTHNMDFAEAAPQLRRFLDRNPHTEFHAIGTDYGTWMKLPQDRCRFTPWVADVEDFYRTIDYDIAIAPLRPHVFNQSKSYIKYLETAALGIPMITSETGPYAEAIQHGVTGFLVKRDHDWAAYLRALTNDAEMRHEMGAAAKAWARTKTIEGNISILEKVFTA